MRDQPVKFIRHRRWCNESVLSRYGVQQDRDRRSNQSIRCVDRYCRRISRWRRCRALGSAAFVVGRDYSVRELQSAVSVADSEPAEKAMEKRVKSELQLLFLLLDIQYILIDIRHKLF